MKSVPNKARKPPLACIWSARYSGRSLANSNLTTSPWMKTFIADYESCNSTQASQNWRCSCWFTLVLWLDEIAELTNLTTGNSFLTNMELYHKKQLLSSRRALCMLRNWPIFKAEPLAHRTCRVMSRIAHTVTLAHQ